MSTEVSIPNSNIPSQSIPTPAPPKKNTGSKKTIVLSSIIFILILALGLSIFGNFYLISNQKEPLTTPTTIPAVKTTLVITPTDSAARENQLNYSPIYQSNTTFSKEKVYLAEYNGDTVLAYRSYPDSEDITLVYADERRNSEGNSYEIPITSFGELKNVTTVFKQTYEGQSYWTSGFKIDQSTGDIYFGISSIEDPQESYPDTTTIYVFNTSLNTRALLYKKNLVNDTTITNYANQQVETVYTQGGLFVDDLLEDKYLVVRATQCYACDEIGPGAVILLNVETVKEIILPEIDNLKVKSNMLEYQTLDKAFQPTGEVKTVELP